MKTQFNLFAILLFISISQFTFANDGSALHKDNCIACHAAMTGGDGSVLYTRKDHKVTNSEELSKQVHRCQSSLELNWSEQQIHAVQTFLDKMYYKF